MKKSLLSLASAVALYVHGQDQCATALPVGTGTYVVTVIDGTQAPFPICDGSGVNATMGEWYTYTPSQDTALTVSTDLPVNAGRDTRVHIYSDGCANLTCAGGDDDSGSGFLSVATVNVTAGVTYHIAFDDRWESDGFSFQLAVGPPLVGPSGFTPQPITTVGYANCVVDMNGDFLDDVVSTTETVVNINHQQSGGGFVPVNITTTQADNDASWSIAAGDLDDNGFNDLMYGGGSGVTFMMANGTGTAFTEVSFPQYVFCQRTNMVDLDSDGHLDAFSCHDVDANVYYTNDGTGTLTYHQGGLGETCGNYGSLWTDYDNDGDPDLFVAKCGCDEVDILYRNNGDGTFTDIAPALGLNDGQQSWSSAWGDYDNDGDMDVMVGTSTGDYHKLMRNDLGSFVNITPGSGFDTYTGSSIEFTTHDFDNDGWLDILGGGSLMRNNGDLTFAPVLIQPGNGPIGDLNNDGFLDIVNGSTVYMNNGNDNHYLKVNTIGTVGNRNGIGARVEVVSALGTQIREVRSGDGFSYMSSLTAHFGLGADTAVTQVAVHWPSGLVDVIPAPTIDDTLNIIEGSTTIGMAEIGAHDLSIHPNPVQDVLYVHSMSASSNSRVAILDAAGKQVISTTLRNDQVDVSSLPNGTYILEITSKEGPLRAKFTKR
jgi:hypothetical protein